MAQAESEGQHGQVGLERLVFFSDAVFAIVITLLVLPLTAEIELPEATGSLAPHVIEQWPQVLSFVVSFLVIGQFWIAHHAMFGHVTRFDHGLIWLNLIGLLTISFMPFPTAVLGARVEGEDHFPVVFYALSMTVSSVVLSSTWLYALRRDLVDPSMSASERRQFSSRALVTTATFLLSVGAAALGGLAAALVFWLVLLPLARVVAARFGAGRRQATAAG
jgi:uncharacterized membrane protein